MAVTVAAMPLPYYVSFNNQGQFNVGGTILTQVGGLNAATYQDAAGTIPLPNPIPINSRGEASDASGHSQQIFLPVNTVYQFSIYDKSGNLLEAPQYLNAAQLTAEQIAALTDTVIDNPVIASYNRTAGEISANVTPVNYSYPPGHILRYGTNTSPGVTDMSSATASALAANTSGSVYFPGGTYYHAQMSSFIINSNQTVYGDGPQTLLVFAYGAGNNFQGTSVSNVTVRDMSLQITGTGGNTYIGAVAFISSSFCRALRLSVSGVSGCGVFINASSDNLVQNCTFNSFQGTNQDQADIYIGQLSGSTSSMYNVVDGNLCFGGGWHGIILQTQNAGVAPNLYNIVTNNRVGQHVAYGIANYSGSATVDNFNQIIGNYIENIQGTALSGQAGAGIYSVSAGGNVIANNTIRNCCVQTSSQSLAPGGIGVAQVNGAGISPVVVSGNNISGMSKYFGIYVTLCDAGVTLSGNTVYHPGSNVTGSAIGLQGSSNVCISGGNINSVSTQAAIISNAVVANVSNITISGVTIRNAGTGIFLTSSGSFTHAQVTVNGNQLVSANAVLSFNCSFLAGATVTGNSCVTGASNATSWSNCLQTRLSNNSFVCTGSYSVLTNGTCTGSLCDQSNYLAASGTNQGLNSISNSGTGFNFRQTSTAAPSAAGSQQQLGDIAYNTAGVSPSAWVCTTAGTPGAFTGQTLP